MSVESNVIGLKFAKKLCVDGLTLIALPKEVEKAIENGEEVCFKSSSDEGMTRAVLCTDQSTYAMMRVESSNVSFLADISQTGSAASKQRREGDREAPNVVAIQDQFQSSLELFVEVPDFTSLRRSLQQHVFSVSDDKEDSEGESAVSGLTFTQILEQTCASNAEIPRYLDSQVAFMRVPVDGSLYAPLRGDDRFVFVEDETLDTHFDLLLVAVMSQGLSLTKGDVAVDAVVKACDVQGSAAHTVVRHLIHALRPRRGTLDGKQFQLDPAAVARYRIGFVNRVVREVLCSPDTYVLRQDVAKEWPMNDLIQECVTDCPLECEAFLSADHVRQSGLALCLASGSSNVVRYLEPAQLPHGIPERFEFLFGLKPQWTEAEIVPFVQLYAVHGNTVASILMEHTRSFSKPSRTGSGEETFYVRR